MTPIGKGVVFPKKVDPFAKTKENSGLSRVPPDTSLTANVPNGLERGLYKFPPKMGMLDQFFHGRDVGKVTREKMGQMVRILLDAQEEQLAHRLTLRVDYQKKKDYAEYQSAVDQVNKQILESSESLVEELIDLIEAASERVEKRKKRWRDRMEQMNLPPDDRAEHIQRIKNWVDFEVQQTEGKVMSMIESTRESLERTMRLMKGSDDGAG